MSRPLPLLFAFAAVSTALVGAPATPAPAPAAATAAPAAPAAAKAAFAPAAAATPAPIEAPRYELKNKSSFALPTDVRAPFWPIGWKKNGSNAAPIVQTAKMNPDLFKVSSILLGSIPIAVINNRSYEEGQFLRLPKGSQVRIKVYRITDGKVWLQNGEQLIPVDLKRGELNDPKADTELLNAEKDDVFPAELLKSAANK